MLDNLKGLAGLAGIMKDLPRIKARYEAARERLAARTVEASTGGGAVRVVATGELKVRSIEIDPALFSTLAGGDDPTDRALGSELVVNAVNAALAKARELAQEELKAAAEELGLPIPAGLNEMLGG